MTWLKMATFDDDEDCGDQLFYHQLVKPPAIYSSNTWSNKSRKPIQNHITRPPLVKHASVEYQIRETSLDNTNQSAPVRNSICGQNLREIATSQTELPECQDLSILDLQTLRRDSKVKNSTPGSKSNIRLPQQDVFRVHKPGFHISSERVWFPRTVSVEKPYDDEHFDLQNNHENNSEESPTLGSDEVEVKLPCRSVSINVVGMASNNDEVNSRPSPCSNDFQETIQTGCQQPLLLTSILPPPPPPHRQPAFIGDGGLGFSTLPPVINGERGECQNPLRDVGVNPGLNQTNGQNGERQSQILVTTKHDIESRFDVEKLSTCCRYRKPAAVSLFSVGLILIITFLVLYWNYYETVHRRMTKKKGYILDHWGKGSPSAAETAVLDLEVEILKQQERETQRKEGQLDDLLVIDGRPFNEDSDQTMQPSQFRTTSMAPSIDYDSRVD